MTELRFCPICGSALTCIEALEQEHEIVLGRVMDQFGSRILELEQELAEVRKKTCPCKVLKESAR
jgi:hypothetical protein